MQVTIGISMYPNREEFIPPIDDLIKKINTFDHLEVKTFPTSTVVQGKINTRWALFRIRSPRAISNMTWQSMWSRLFLTTRHCK
jgi:uncharacterized protein YqgV (UPF0045/DUF77 family)